MTFVCFATPFSFDAFHHVFKVCRDDARTPRRGATEILPVFQLKRTMSRCRENLMRSYLWYDERLDNDVVCNGKGNGPWKNLSTRRIAPAKIAQLGEHQADDRKVLGSTPGRAGRQKLLDGGEDRPAGFT